MGLCVKIWTLFKKRTEREIADLKTAIKLLEENTLGRHESMDTSLGKLQSALEEFRIKNTEAITKHEVQIENMTNELGGIRSSLGNVEKKIDKVIHVLLEKSK